MAVAVPLAATLAQPQGRAPMVLESTLEDQEEEDRVMDGPQEDETPQTGHPLEDGSHLEDRTRCQDIMIKKREVTVLPG